MPVITLTLAQARALHLAAQGLLAPPAQLATPAALCACIARMGLLQIDTIHVVARSPYLVLFSRLGPYPMHWLDEALATGQLFETWAHEACFAPMADLLLHRSYNQQARQHWGLASARHSHIHQRAHLDQLLLHIRQNGAVKSSDFTRQDDRTSAWWGWKDEKRWLEALFASGELMVARREKFQRVYDLAERVAPQLATAPAAGLAPDAIRQQFIERSVTALGVTQARWIHDYFRLKPRLKDADLAALVEAGALLRVAVQGWDQPAYVHASQADWLQQAVAGQLQARHTALLSPFDPVVWDRERLATLFDFDYRLECYTPEPKRVHGYFVLPILHAGELIGRLDAKAHRAQGVFEVKSLSAQPGRRWSEAQSLAVAKAIWRCAQWHGTPEVQLTGTRPANLAPTLRRAWREIRKESAG
ncbi:MAG: crosslink repair DNA glycosylase YcaQ family protein [Rhodoferax sp.]|nr:crosslink repair DNA glycosylase YcaQ family protein [Rhodoferax sp.]MDD2925201.1 crosslink repair DNA glycosylase YcaQ family protein [Rhodoferax sp.]